MDISRRSGNRAGFGQLQPLVGAGAQTFERRLRPNTGLLPAASPIDHEEPRRQSN